MMVSTCQVDSTSQYDLQGLASFIECRASDLGQNSFYTLTSGPIFPAFLSACLTIYVGLLGYRLLLGRRIEVADLVWAAARVGLVITFSMSWSAYATVFYDVVTDAPFEISATLLQRSGLSPLATADLASRTERVYDDLERRSVATTGTPFGERPNPDTVSMPPANAGPANRPNQPGLTLAGLILFVFSVGATVALHVAAGVLLALGPLIIALSLFDALAGWFTGWVRALSGVVLGGTGLATLLAFELEYLEAWNASLQAMKGVREQDLQLTVVLFGVLATAMLFVSATVARGFSLPRRSATVRKDVHQEPRLALERGTATREPGQVQSRVESSRASAIVDALTMRRRYDERTSLSKRMLDGNGPDVGDGQPPLPGGAGAPIFQPLGQTLRRPRLRRTASGDLRRRL